MDIKKPNAGKKKNKIPPGHDEDDSDRGVRAERREQKKMEPPRRPISAGSERPLHDVSNQKFTGDSEPGNNGSLGW